MYSYEYMKNWKRFNETSLPDKKYFYGSFNIVVSRNWRC